MKKVVAFASSFMLVMGVSVFGAMSATAAPEPTPALDGTVIETDEGYQDIMPIDGTLTIDTPVETTVEEVPEDVNQNIDGEEITVDRSDLARGVVEDEDGLSPAVLAAIVAGAAILIGLILWLLLRKKGKGNGAEVATVPPVAEAVVDESRTGDYVE